MVALLPRRPAVDVRENTKGIFTCRREGEIRGRFENNRIIEKNRGGAAVFFIRWFLFGAPSISDGHFRVADNLVAEFVSFFEFEHNRSFGARNLGYRFVESGIERLSDRFERIHSNGFERSHEA